MFCKKKAPAFQHQVARKGIRPTDFAFTDDKSCMVLKDDALEIELDRFLETLEPLEHKSLPIIRTVEKMLFVIRPRFRKTGHPRTGA